VEEAATGGGVVRFEQAHRVRHFPLALLLIGLFTAVVIGTLLSAPVANRSGQVGPAVTAAGVLVAVAVGAWLVRKRLRWCD